MEQEFAEGIDSWETMMFLYNSALKEVNTKLEILNDEFVHIHNYNPIEYIKSRIKTPESIVKKLQKGRLREYHREYGHICKGYSRYQNRVLVHI